MTRHDQNAGLSITIDVEDHASGTSDLRFRAAMQPLVDGLRERGTRATFFVVGTIIPHWSDQMRELAAEGHEVGLHGYTHRFLKDVGRAAFADDLRRGFEAIAEQIGRPPAGFRAPYFSLTDDTPWAPDAITEAGFMYSSSVLPAWNPQAGLPRAPRQPFRWPSGLVEFPVPVFGIGPLRLPVLGGAYLRLAPSFLVDLAARRGKGDFGRWSYSHPYDFDTEEAFCQRDGQSWLFSKLLFARRRLMLERVLGLVGPNSTTLESRASDDEFVTALPTFSLDT